MSEVEGTSLLSAHQKLVLTAGDAYCGLMSVTEIMHEIEALPTEVRLRLVEKLVQLTEADVPDSLRESMAQAARGEFIEMDEALKALDQS